MSKRIYLVTIGDEQHLIKASNKSQAVRHVADHTIKAEVATQDQLVTMITSGTVVVEAGADKGAHHENDPL